MRVTRFFSGALTIFVLSMVVSMEGVKAQNQPIKVLLVGGGDSHDFDTWYKEADASTLEKGGLAEVEYTSDVAQVPALLKNADVLVLSNNQHFEEPQRKAITDFVNSGKGLVLLHPATWYNWKEWPEYNRDFVGGGAKGHEEFGDFEVTVTDTTHEITARFPRNFEVTDELYLYETDPKAAKIKILATSKSSKSKKPYPSLFVVDNPKARIVGFTLGHDDQAHRLNAYQAILRNAVKWAAGK